MSSKSPEPETMQQSWKPAGHEPEHQGSIWNHPYMIYIYLTAALFVVLGVISWLAWINGWVPTRTI